jgi:CRP-like cAMP-binding protein
VILSLARHQQFKAPSVIIHQGDAAERLCLLTSGQGAHFVLTNKGDKVLLHWLTAGQIFGGAAMLSVPCQYLANTEVQTESCALVWNRPVIRELVSRFPLLMDNTLSIAVTEHIALFMAARISLSVDDARSRVARLLTSLACGIGKNRPDGIEIQIGNEDLSAGANVTPYTVSRYLAEWERGGILTKGRGKVLLHRPELLLPRPERTCSDLRPPVPLSIFLLPFDRL